MNYWMFTVMYDMYPTLWPAMVERRLAAQHYPSGWTNEARNINALRQMKKGDAVVAALKRHRFAGYGFLTTDFYRGGKSLNIQRHQFQERAEIDWVAIPRDREPPYVDCGHLKAEGYDVDLRRGLCVWSTNERTFTRVREMLDRAGAGRRPAGDSLLPEEVMQPRGLAEGALRPIMVNAYERNPEARRQCKEAHGTTCIICGFNFGAVFGPEAVGYIHVHHLVPLSQVRKEYIVNPVEDLRPVCANCHAFVHMGGQCRSIDEVRQLLQRRKRSRTSHMANRFK